MLSIFGDSMYVLNEKLPIINCANASRKRNLSRRSFLTTMIYDRRVVPFNNRKLIADARSHRALIQFGRNFDCTNFSTDTDTTKNNVPRCEHRMHTNFYVTIQLNSLSATQSLRNFFHSRRLTWILSEFQKQQFQEHFAWSKRNFSSCLSRYFNETEKV